MEDLQRVWHVNRERLPFLEHAGLAYAVFVETIYHTHVMIFSTFSF